MSKKLLNLVLISLLLPLCSYGHEGDALNRNENETKHFVIGDLEWSPSSDVYDDWNNFSVHTRVSDVPDQFEIDLTDFEVPIKSNQVTSPFGKRIARNHDGVDIQASLGDTIYSVFDGKVRYAQYNSGGYGFAVVIRHYNGLETYYAHLSQIRVNVNEYVIAGQPIGMAGNTGRSSGVHLHFETRFCGIPIYPQKMISFKYGFPLTETYQFNKVNKYGGGNNKGKTAR